MSGNKLIFHFILLLCFCFPGLGAQDSIPPERPLIRYVTVDTATGNTIIYWTESDSPDVEWYYIYYEIMTVNGMEGVKLDSVPPGNSSYVHEGNTVQQPLIYSISAIDSAGNESLRTPGFHRIVQLSLVYDSCNDAINVNWTKYLGWGSNISGYRIYKRRSGSAYDPPVGVGKNDSTFRFENIQQNTPYSFYIEALKNDTLISTSAIESKYTYMPGPPDSFNLVSVNVISESALSVNFEFTDTSGISNFRLLRSIDPSTDYISASPVKSLTEGNNTFIDSIITGTERYFYKIGSLNSCNKVIKETNRGTNILLSGKNQGDENMLSWNDYEYWSPGVEEYRIIMYDENNNPEILSTTQPDINYFNHDLRDISGTGFDGKIRYRIIAKKTMEDLYSQSNIIEIEVAAGLTVPNAFTPNNDGINDIFRPYFRFLPQRFKMVVYDRYGIVIFSTENPEEGWDGRINAGGMVTEGVYVYHIQYTDHAGTKGEKTGHLTVFYP